MTFNRTLLKSALGALVFVGAAGAAAAYPDRPIQVIVPYPAGGGTDTVARTLVAELEKELGVSINVVNRGGGGGLVGSSTIARAKPDGYTIGLLASDISGYEPQGLSDLTYEDFTPIGQTNELASSVTVIADSPYKTINDLLTAIEESPNELKGTGATPGQNWHVGYLGMMQAAGLDTDSVIWVPTQGGTAGHMDVAAGNSTFSTASLAEARALIESDKLKALAVMSNDRSDLFPDVPTLKEQGVDHSFNIWHGVVGPKDLPQEVLDVLLPAVEKAAKSEEFTSTLEGRGFTVVWRPRDEFKAYLADEYEAAKTLFAED